MIDIKNLRDNIDATSEALLRRGYKLEAKKFKSLDSERKALQVNVETLQSSRKKLSEEFGKLKASGSDTASLKEEIDTINSDLKRENELLNVLLESINEYLLDRLKIVPNPTYGTIEIISLSNTSKSYELKISNLSGQVLFSKTKIATTKYDREKIDISLFPKGVYIVERKDHNKTLSKRLIKL